MNSSPAFELPDLDAITIADQHKKRGIKWSRDGESAISAWVADMDFPPPAAVTHELQCMLDTNDFGYFGLDSGKAVVESYVRRMQNRFGWSPDPELTITMGDVVQGLNVAVATMTDPGDGVLVTTPVYHPFLYAIDDNNRRQVSHQLHRSDGWALDVDRMAAGLDDRTKLMLLCNPHNPAGRVFDRAELTALAELVVARDIVVLTDEIHGDLVFDGEHIPFASLGDEVAARTITMTSATKAFNIAGMRCSVTTFGSAELQQRWQAIHPKALGAVSTPGMVTTVAAWEHGQPWLDHVMTYLRANRDHLVARVAAELPAITVDPPEATYLAWLDCSALDLGPEPHEEFLARAGIAVSPGTQFGDGGDGHVRINFATSRQILDEIIDRMVAAFA